MTGMAMNGATLHPVPRWGAAFREQLAVTGLALRREVIVLLVLAALLVWTQYDSAAGAMSRMAEIERFTAERGGRDAIAPRFDVYASGLATPLALAALLVPLGVWRGRDPSRRAFHAALPLPDARHTLLTVVCGWLWLVVGVAVVQLAIYAAAQLVLGMVDGLPRAQVRYPGTDGGAWRWLVPFTAASIGYLFGSAVVLASRHPWRVMLAVLGILVSLELVVSRVADRPDMSPVPALFEGRMGLRAAIDGVQLEERTAEVGEYLVAYSVSGGAAGPMPEGATHVFTVEVPDRGRWLAAASLWLALGAAAVTGAVRGRRE